MNARQLIENDDLKGELLSGLPLITPGEFDNFEVHGMAFLGAIGDYDNAEPADDRTNPDFWTVFGHYSPASGKHGVETVMDYDTEAVANAVASELTARYAHKQFGGQVQEAEEIKREIIAGHPVPRIRVAYEKNPVGDAEDGERGWIEEEGVDMTPDAFERDNGETSVALATAYLEAERGDALYPSASYFHPGVWYTTRYAGATHSYHLTDFSPEEERAVYDAMTS